MTEQVEFPRSTFQLVNVMLIALGTDFWSIVLHCTQYDRLRLGIILIVVCLTLCIVAKRYILQ